VFLAFAVSMAVLKLVGSELSPYLILWPVVMLLGIIEGFWSGLIATVSAGLLTAVWIIPADGRVEFQEVVGLAIFCIIGMFTNGYVARLRIAKEKAASHEMLERFVEYCPVALAMFDRNMCYIQASERWRSDYGLDHQDLKGKSHYELFPNLPERWKEVHRRALAGEVVHHESDSFEMHDGSIQWLEWEVRPWRDPRGEIGGVVIYSAMITSRKRAEEALRDSESRFRRAQHAAHIGTWRYVPGQPIHWSDETYELFKLPRAIPVTYEAIVDVMHPADRDQRAFEKALATGATDYRSEYRVVWPNSQVHTILSIGRINRDSNGNVIDAIGTAQDITEFRKAEEELKFRNAVLTAEQELSIDGILVVDDAARIVSYNRRFAEMWAIPRELIEDKDDTAVLPFACKQVADPSGFLERVKHLYAHKEQTSEDEVALKDGRVFERYSAPMIGADNHYYGRVWNFRDITKRKQMEMELKQSEAKFRSYIVHAPFAILVVDGQGHIHDSNVTAVEMFGYEEQTLRRMNVRELHLNRDHEMVGKTVSRLFENGSVVDEFKMVRRDGKEIAVSLQAVALNDGLSIGFLHDVTEQRAAEEQMKVLEEQFRQAQKMEAVGRLAGGIAHDFNNLLMVIMAQTELLKETEVSARPRAEEILKSARRAANLTRQLLAFSRKQTIQPTVATLNDTVTGISDMLKRLVGEDIDVKVALDPQPWPVKIDCSQFEQVIMNLVVNARDAMPKGGKLTLATENCAVGDDYHDIHQLVPVGDYAMFSISDTGKGMPPEVQARIFEPFFTTKEMGKGTGLGLSMVYGIVKQSGGFIWTYSEIDRGTTFKIYVPRAVTGSPAQTPQRGPANSPPMRKATVLLVEDDDSLREAISAFLESGGHTVLTSGDYFHAKQLAEERSGDVDLLLTDVVLKGGNGRDLVNSLETGGCSFKVVYMSGYTPDAIVHHGVLEPGTHFLQKPFSRDALLSKVEAVLCQ